MLLKGEKAPNFRTIDSYGNTFELNDYIGKKVILYFYPKNDTPNCVIQAKGYNDKMHEFEKENVVVFGIAPETPNDHLKFLEKYCLDLNLLCDLNYEISKKYGVYDEKLNLTEHNSFVLRSSFLIDEEGYLKLANYNVDEHDDPDDMLSALWFIELL